VKVALHIPSTELTSFLDIYIDCGVNCFLLLTLLSNEDGLLLLALLIVLALSTLQLFARPVPAIQLL